MNAVCTLFEGHYHLGAGALINSLHASDYRGPVICGHRGPLPPWTSQAAAAGLDVRFVSVTASTHLTFHKPAFLQAVLEVHVPEAGQAYYFDPDIVVEAPWEVMERWAADGIALCEDVNPNLPARHPYRLRWDDFLRRWERPPIRPLDRYYNAGFIGLPRSQAAFLRDWERLNDLCAAEAGSADQMKTGSHHAIFHTADQDALNLALMSSAFPINGAGSEAMGFRPGSRLLAHAIGRAKPWRGGFLGAAWHGYPPSSAQKAYFRFVEKPLRLLPPVQLAGLRWSLRLATFLSRFYRRA